MAKYFNNLEIEGLNQRLVVMLDQMRDRCEIPISITCGLRNEEQNKKIGGVKDSAHLKGLAVDIRCKDSIARFKYLEAAFNVGFRRIEVAPLHLHLDIAENLPQNVCWIGTDH